MKAIRSTWKTALLSTFVAIICVLACLGVDAAGGSQALAAENTQDTGAREVKILFTHDIHSNLDPAKGLFEDGMHEYGGGARLATLLEQNSDENTIFLDAGDFAMGTLFQAGFSTDAYELRTLGNLGYTAVTLGNHEWDQAGTGLAKMLRAALASGDPLPQLVISNLDFSGDLTDEQRDVQAALEEYGAKNYTIVTVNGVRVGIFGVSGENSIEDSPTSGMKWIDAIEAAKATVAEIGDQADIIVCLSHSGTKGDGENGEDFDLIKAVPEIDLVISAHTHVSYTSVVETNGSFLGSAGDSLRYLGSITLSVSDDGTVSCMDYQLIPVDETVTGKGAIQEQLDQYKSAITASYLAEYAPGASFDEVIARSPFDFISMSEMEATHQEYPIGDLIADSYLYEARQNGIDDIDVALVGLGTIRGTLVEGDITTAGAFNICSLGAGADGSAGHPLVAPYITGKELKLLVELDASLGPLVGDIKMSYAGLSYRFNTARMILDRVTELELVRPDGSTEAVQDDKLYRVCCNMYAANMLGMLNGLTKGILTITPKYADGSTVEDFYTCALYGTNGKELKEWVAFRDYLMSFDKQDGVSVIPAKYAGSQDRKVPYTEHGLAVIANPGPTTLAVFAAIVVVVLIIVLIVHRVKKRRKKRAARQQQ